MNFITFIGNLGRDPEMRYTPSGAGMTSFSVAENNKYTKGDGESVEETQWFNCTAWGRLAEVCNQYLSKGSQVMIVGRLTHRLYNAQDGSTRVSLDVNVEKMQMCGGRGELDTGGQGTERRPTNNGQQRRPQPAGRNYDDMDIGQDDIDDLPF